MARYLISEAARVTGVDAHVLRFWEEELELEIPRNEQGHRYYTEENIAVFHRIKLMKEAGLPLKMIREKLANPEEDCEGNEKEDIIPARQEKVAGTQSDARMMEFESIVYDIVTEALRNNNEKLGKAVSERVNDKVVKELNYLMRENEESMESHFRKLDEALVQRGRGKKPQKKGQISQGQKEAAVSRVGQVQLVSQSKKKRHLFGRKRKTAVYEIH